MSVRRVTVTGVGAVTPLGPTLAATLDALAHGAVAARPPAAFGSSAFAGIPAAAIDGFDARAYFRVPKALKLTDRATRFAIAASRMALADAGWPVDDAPHDTLGVVMGTSGSDLRAEDLARALAGGGDSDAHDIPWFAGRILSGLNPLWLLVNLPNMASAHVAIQVGARGPNSTVMTDWVAGAQAIGEALEWIRAGETDAVLAGGADSAMQPFAYASYAQAGLLDGDPHASIVPAEAAGVLLLEERDRAIPRGAPGVAELRAYAAGASSTGGVPDGTALARAMRDVLAQAEWTPADVHLLTIASVCAPPFVAAERQAICDVFGTDRSDRVRRFTPSVGHALGAAGAVDAALAVAAETGGPSRRILCAAYGYSGQAVALGFET